MPTDPISGKDISRVRTDVYSKSLLHYERVIDMYENTL